MRINIGGTRVPLARAGGGGGCGSIFGVFFGIVLVPLGFFLAIYGEVRLVDHGKVFEIGCFGAAPGCFSYGPATSECTWFAGCSWRFSLCTSCFTHLGWKYKSSLTGSFFGLILANLVKD